MLNVTHKNSHRADEYYMSEDNRFRIMREAGKTPNGNPMNNRWVLRDMLTNQLIDFDKYRYDLFERNEIIDKEE
jgi:hypothetical protein